VHISLQSPSRAVRHRSLTVIAGHHAALLAADDKTSLLVDHWYQQSPASGSNSSWVQRPSLHCTPGTACLMLGITTLTKENHSSSSSSNETPNV